MVPHLGHTKPIAVVVTAHVYMSVFVKTQREKCENSYCLVCKRIYLHSASLGLTFAGLDALKPPVIGVSVVVTPAASIPSTARSTTTDSTGILEHATLWAHHVIVRGDS